MTIETDRVAQILAGAEDVDLPEALVAQARAPHPGSDDPAAQGDDPGPDEGGMPPPPPPSDNDGVDWALVEKASTLPMHDVGKIGIPDRP